jgi:uroporphyrinogen decarboxylase
MADLLEERLDSARPRRRTRDDAMSEMTTHERVGRMYQHREADRVPLYETPWLSTLERWRREGMGDADYVDYFGLDRIVELPVDNSPRFPTRVLEQSEDHFVYTNAWGATMMDWKHQASVPALIDVTVKTPDDWLKAKERMTPSDDRIPWEYLKREWPRWRKRGAWIGGLGWFGFDVTHAWFIGTERELLALAENPEWCVDMWRTQQDLNFALLDRVWEAGYQFDELRWYDDMGYKQNQFFSLKMYRELLKPIHQRAIDWAHAKGIRAYLHSCGDIRPFIPDLVEMGLDGLNPLEVKAGVDPLAVKREFGDRLLLHGGFNALLWNDVEEMEATVHRNLPALMEGGGYVFATDHSTPSNVSLQDFKRIVQVVKDVGRY